MSCGTGIPTKLIKEITGAKTDEAVAVQARVAIGMLEAYLGIILIKRDFKNERITVPYSHSRIFKVKHAPLNSVSELSLLTGDATYKVSDKNMSLGFRAVEVLGKLPAHIGAVRISYNAGYFDSWSDMPGLLQQAALDLLDYKYNTDAHAGFNSEHLGDYSYSKGGFVRGIPAEIAGVLDGVEL